MSDSARLWTLLHTKGLNPCGKPALKACRQPVRTDPITPALMRNIDGSVPLASDSLVCQSCGEQLRWILADDFTEDSE